MPNNADNADIPRAQNGPDDDKWNVVLDDDFVRGAAVREGVPPTWEPEPTPKRVWPRNAALAVAAATVAFLALKFTGSDGSSSEEDTAAPATTASATAESAASATASAAPAGTERPMIPLTDAFPAQVPDGRGGTFTKLGAVVLESCTERDSVGPGLAALIDQSKGCVGEEIALYKDAQNNQYNLAVFTMKDPQDTVKLVTRLSMAFDNYEVAAQAPPPGSGLPTLPADSGMVQSFTGQGRAMVVGLGQWSDGRLGDFQQLVDRLGPLLKAVSDNVGRYETGS